jgi:phosphomannomutase
MSTILEVQRSRTVGLPLETRTSVLDRLRRTLVQEATRVEGTDGVDAFYPDGVIRIRATGPEPVCEVLVESSSTARADALLDRAATLVSDLVRALGTGDSAGDMWCAPE